MSYHMTFGPRTQFVPIFIRHKHGYYGGPVGYQEIRDPTEAAERGAIELRAGRPLLLGLRQPEPKGAS